MESVRNERVNIGNLTEGPRLLDSYTLHTATKLCSVVAYVFLFFFWEERGGGEGGIAPLSHPLTSLS